MAKFCLSVRFASIFLSISKS